jgi:hypothetical protein
MPGLVPARIAAVVLLGVAVFQVLLVLGIPWGAWTQGGANEGVLPTGPRVIAGVSCVLLVVMALSILGRAGSGPFASLPRGVVTFLAWATTIYTGIGVLLNLATPSAVERATFAPLTLVAFVCCVLVLRATRRQPTTP